MAFEESTAVNELIRLASMRTVGDIARGLVRDSEPTLIAPPPRPPAPTIEAPPPNDATSPVGRASLRDRVIWWMAVAVLAGVVAGLVERLATGRASTRPSAAPTLTVEPIEDVRPSPQVGVRFDSRPSGATVMLIDDSGATRVGPTPVEASLDASRGYDVVFTLAGHRAKLAHVDPSASRQIRVELER